MSLLSGTRRMPNEIAIYWGRTVGGYSPAEVHLSWLL